MRPNRLESGVTRRSVLKGAGAAIALGAAGGPAEAASPEACRAQRQKPPYDIRDQIQDSELDADCIQCVYDDINRMVILIGDIPFRRLFHKPMSELVPQVRARLGEAQRYGLLDDPAQTDRLAQALQQQAPELSIGAFYARSRGHVPRDVQAILIGLRRQGIRIPLPNAGGKEAKTRSRVVRRLVHDASDLTFKQYYTVAKRHLPHETRHALTFARQNALLGWGNNDRCCDHDKFTKLDFCRPRTDKFCALALDPAPTEHHGVLYGFCIDTSDKC